MQPRPRVWHIGGDDVDLRIPLLRRIRQAGFDVAAVGTRCAAAFAAAGIPYLEYGLAAGMGPLSDLAARRQLVRMFKNDTPDIVHAFDTKPGLLVPDAVRACGRVRCVRTITGMGRLFAMDELIARIGRMVYRSAHRRVARGCSMTIFQNSDDQEYFLEHDLLRGRPHTMVPGSGVDPAQIRAAAPAAAAVAALRRELGASDGFLVLMVARLVEAKGVREFMHAAAAVRRDRPVTAVLVGPADEADRSARDLLHEVEDHPDVVYLGKRDDVPALLAAADVFVLPTYYREGLPRVLLEAAVMGVPLVATPVPGCREVVEDEVTGLVVQPRDADGLAHAIRRLVDDQPLRERLAAAAEQRVLENFSLERVARDYVDIYRSLLV